MTVSIETIELENYIIVKKFTTDLVASLSQEQDTTSWICPTGVTSARYLVVAGGGSGGVRGTGAGGGGAGGLLTGTIDVIPGTEYTIKIGAGGSGYRVGITNLLGRNGGNSEFNSIVSIGGGAGTGKTAWPGNTGGSGGGSRLNTPAVPGGLGTPGQGHDGGTSAYTYCGGGGGGAGAVGGDCPAVFTGGKGGDGLQSDITGTLTYYAGGGGGSGNTTPGNGGLGGGGRGGSPIPLNGTDGLGGGGGGSDDDQYNAGNGGSGVVILQYALPPKMLVRSGFEWL